jgi:fermentation-respiration switch protein FrsA (DUF1100 family)
MTKTLLLGVATIVLAYLCVCLLFYIVQRSQIYFRTPPAARRDAPTLWIESSGARIKVWIVGARADDPAAPALIYFGGNAEDVAGEIEPFGAAFPQRAVYLVNYRGYGGSTGSPSERGLCADSEAVFDVVRRRHPAGAIAVMGRSLGSGVAVHLAAARAAERLVLVTPYDSLVAVAKEHLPWLPVALLMRDRFAAADTVRSGAVPAPALIVIAGDDEIVPARRGAALAHAFPPEQVQVLRIAGATHNTIDLFPQYLETVAAFLRSGDAGPQRRATTRMTVSR